MRGLIGLILFFGLFACDNEDAPNCLKKAGEPMSIEINVELFTQLEVNDQFNVIIEEGEEQAIFLDYFENLIDDIAFEVKENRLVVSDNGSCVWVRDYNFPTLRITSPLITNIRQNGGGVISSQGVLHYNELSLVSEERSGDFDLTIDNESLRIVNNDLTNYRIKGKTDQLYVGFFSGDGRFEGGSLIAQDTEIFHRATNDIVVNTQNSLTGRVLSTGSLIFVGGKPSTIDISIENRGKLVDRTN